MLTPVQNANRTKLITALRSGTYRQGFGALRCGDEYCVGGVACDVVDPNGWYKTHVKFHSWGHTWCAIPKEIQDAYGFADDDGRLKYSPESRDDALMYLNDTKRWTFAQIADYLEAETDKDNHLTNR